MNVVDSNHHIVAPADGIAGTIRVPGDKSISHRLAMLTGLAGGESRIEGFLVSEDCLATLGAVEALGADVRRDGTTVTIRGTGGSFRDPGRALDLGNSGTGMRLLSGLLAGQDFSVEMTGDSSLCSRDMSRIKRPLEQMGAMVELLGKANCAPMRVGGGSLCGIEYKLPVASAQVKSAVLLAGMYADGRTAVIEPKPTRDHTERLLRGMGAPVAVEGLTVSIDGNGGQPLKLESGRKWSVPGDFSSAAFWLVAAACCSGAEVVIENVGLNPRRTALVAVLRRMGSDIEIAAGEDNQAWEPSGSIRIRGGRLRGTVIAGKEIPNLIDELPLVAVAAAVAEGTTSIRDAAELRVKESDRISTMVANLSALGVKTAERPDGMNIEGPSKIHGGVEVSSFGDHRVAMAMAVLSLAADKPVNITETSCVATSYPEFWDDLRSLCRLS